MTTYKDAGVDVEAGEEMVDRIKPLVRKTFTDGVMTDIGAFGAFFRVDWRAYEDPVMVSSVDGVGTKLRATLRRKCRGITVEVSRVDLRERIP